MATPQALECEEDHFDPVIKITNCRHQSNEKNAVEARRAAA